MEEPAAESAPTAPRSKLTANLPEATVQKLDAKRRRRAKKEAREIGYMLFKRLSDSMKQHLLTTIAIMRAARAGGDKQTERTIARSFVEGFLDAAREDRS